MSKGSTFTISFVLLFLFTVSMTMRHSLGLRKSFAVVFLGGILLDGISVEATAAAAATGVREPEQKLPHQHDMLRKLVSGGVDATAGYPFFAHIVSQVLI